MNNLRISSKPSEISTILYQLYLENIKVKVWQNVDKKRIVTHGSISHINLEKMVMKVTLEDESSINFDDKVHLYIFSEEKSVVFKISAIKQKNILLFDFPEEVRMREKRDITRVKISHELEEISVAACLLSDKSNSPRIFKFKLIDFSMSGLGIESVGKYNKFLYERDKLSFLFINSKKFSTAIKAKIRFIHLNHRNRLRLGLQFETELKESEYNEFLHTISPIEAI